MPVRIEVTPNGPYLIEGEVELIDAGEDDESTQQARKPSRSAGVGPQGSAIRPAFDQHRQSLARTYVRVWRSTVFTSATEPVLTTSCAAKPAFGATLTPKATFDSSFTAWASGLMQNFTPWVLATRPQHAQWRCRVWIV